MFTASFFQNLISSLSSEEISKNLENEIESLQKDGIIDQVVNTAAEIVKEGKSEDELIDELVTLKKIGSFGNFDQITIERDHEGSMIITKTQRVSENEKGNILRGFSIKREYHFQEAQCFASTSGMMMMNSLIKALLPKP